MNLCYRWCQSKYHKRANKKKLSNSAQKNCMMWCPTKQHKRTNKKNYALLLSVLAVYVAILCIKILILGDACHCCNRGYCF